MSDKILDFLLGTAITFNILDLLTTAAVFALAPLGVAEFNPFLAFIIRYGGLWGFFGLRLLAGTAAMCAFYHASKRTPLLTVPLATACSVLIAVSAVNLAQVIGLVLAPVMGWTL